MQVTLAIHANNGAPMIPIMIVTRPGPQGAAFAASIRDQWDAPLTIILSPLLQIVPVTVRDDLSGISAVVFTSANGVAQAAGLGLPHGITAYCVGEQTAAAAARAGFSPVTGPGDAEQLTALIVAKRPAGTLAHIRGRHARGNITAALTRAGLPCRDVIAYDQKVLPLTDAAQSALQGRDHVLVPLFSPRSSSVFQSAGPFAAPLHIVAISAAALPDMPSAQTVTVADTPDGSAMVRATIGCLCDISDRFG